VVSVSPWRRLRLPLLALLGLLVVGACLADAEPSPSPSSAPSLLVTAPPTAEPSPTATPRQQASDGRTLVVMAPDHPTRLLPGDNLNATESLLVDVLYDPLYRLDEQQRPVPELAKELPQISEDGLTWTIPIKVDARFHSGAKLRASDVTFSLRMAASPSCPLGRALCETVRNYMVGNPERDDNVVSIELREPYAPFLTEVLGRLPILSEADVKTATDELIAAAGRLNENRPDAIISEITQQTLRDECLEAEPPDGCRLRDHREDLEQIFTRARIDLPPRAPYVDETGAFNEDAYLGALLKRLEALAQVFSSLDSDKTSAALGLLDATVKPFGGGPYALVGIEDDGSYVLQANPDHTRRVAQIERMEVRIERDPSVATTRLLTGEADWILQVTPEQADIIDAAAGFSAASRPIDTQFGILFNVRSDRIYFDVATRRAFIACIDHEGLATALDDERHLATTPFTATSWAQPEASLQERDVDAANALLDAAGWSMATDGVRVREDGTRLSTTIAVRPTSVDLFTFANQAAEQLRECGMELIVEELDLTGDTMLNQLRWPNDFDTLLWLRRPGPDPDSAVRVFESSRVTSEDNVADENPSGFTSELVDFFVASARDTYDEAERVTAYAEVQAELRKLVPYWPLWYDSATSAVSSRLRGPAGPVDPSGARYDWDIASWTLEPKPAGELEP
jgi:ABC-type transport system substrate-binding protein